MKKLFLFVFALAILLIPLISASEIQLLCLEENQTVKFSECNSTMDDYICESDSCSLCVTFTDSGVYCQSNPAICNSMPNLSCSSLIELDDSNDTTNNSTSLTAALGNSRFVIQDAYPETIIERSLRVINRNNFPVTIELTPSGDLANQIILSQNNFILQPDEERIVNFTIQAQNTANSTETYINVRFSAEGRNSVSLKSTILIVTSASIPVVDVAYILRDPTRPAQAVTQALIELGYDYDLIDDDMIPITDFSEYNIIIVLNERIIYPELLPINTINSKKGLIANTYFLDKWKIAKSASSYSPNQPAKGNIVLQNTITSGLTSPVTLYNSASHPVHYLTRRAGGMQNVLMKPSGTPYPFIGIIDIGGKLYPNSAGTASSRTVFFGITETQYWTQESKQLFKQSLKWLTIGDDLDSDTYFSEIDCNDKNASIHPNAQEIPYDGIDQNCNGSDLNDLDEDTFIASIAGGNDCNDQDATINPSSLDKTKNCINDAPIIQPIQTQTFKEGDLISLTIIATDPENDMLSYSISGNKFSQSSQLSNIFTWQTSFDDSDNYSFTISVTDGSLSDSKAFQLTIDSTNRPPVFTAIPDLSWDEDSSIQLNLNDYASDPDGDDLIFDISDTSTDNHIIATQTSSGIYTFTSSSNWHGTVWIIFSASDSHSTIDSNNITLLVTPINDAPTLKASITSKTWNEDSSIIINLDDYFNDIDSSLTYFASRNDKISINILNNTATLIPENNWFGNETIIFTASDGEFQVDSNPIILEILNTDEPPEFLPLNCTSNIDEDTQETCTLEASDVENDALVFSVTNENNLICEISGSTLTYISQENYNGQASCELLVSDKDGQDSTTLQVNITPINDAPTINSFTPEGVIRMLLGTIKQFTISASDIDSQYSNSWIINNQSKSSQDSYTFNATQQGNFLLDAVVSDGELSDSHSWSIFVGDISQFTCSEVSGNICSETQACPGEILGVKDTNACCSTACIKRPPTFSDADACNTKDTKIKIEILDPSNLESFELDDQIKADIRITNNFSEDLEIDVEAHLYNGDKEESIIIADTSINLDTSKSKTTILTLDIPEDIDFEDALFVFIKAEDNICNQAYQEIKIKRPENKVIISNFELPKKASCGEPVEAKIKLENIGTKEQDVKLSIINRQLNINENSEIFTLEQNGEDDTETKTFLLAIPEDASGDYNIEAIANYGTQKVSVSSPITIQCIKQNNTHQIQEEQLTESAQEILSLSSINRQAQAQTPSSAEKASSLLLILMLSTTGIVLSFLLVVFAKKAVSRR